MSEPFVGEIKLVPYNFAPQGYAFCAGQLVAISQNDVLFNLIGTTYGGDGQTTFALPDLRGRAAVHFGTLAGGGTYAIGQAGGTETVTLSPAQLPTHTHDPPLAQAGGASAAAPGGAPASGGPDLYATTSGATLAGVAAGSSQPHDNMAPYLTLNFVIALFGIFPTQN